MIYQVGNISPLHQGNDWFIDNQLNCKNVAWLQYSAIEGYHTLLTRPNNFAWN